jgi:hypothetical protein
VEWLKVKTLSSSPSTTKNKQTKNTHQKKPPKNKNGPYSYLQSVWNFLNTEDLPKPESYKQVLNHPAFHLRPVRRCTSRPQALSPELLPSLCLRKTWCQVLGPAAAWQDWQTSAGLTALSLSQSAGLWGPRGKGNGTWLWPDSPALGHTCLWSPISWDYVIHPSLSTSCGHRSTMGPYFHIEKKKKKRTRSNFI